MKGGNLIIRAGSGTLPEFGGDIIFQLPDGSEFMRIRSDGSVLVRNRFVTTNQSVYLGFCGWLQNAGIIS